MSVATDRDRSARWRHDADGSGDRLDDDVLRPIIAGSFARGIAEAFDLLGVPALFFDREGRVIFASAQARPVMAGDLSLRAGHLLAKAAADEAALAAFVADVLRAPDDRHELALGACGVTLASRPVPGGFAPADQLLHAIVLLSREA